MELILKVGLVPIPIVQCDVAEIVVQIFDPSNDTVAESVFNATAHNPAAGKLVLPNHLFAGVLSFLDIVGDIGVTETGGAVQQQSVKRIAEAAAHRTDQAVFLKRVIVIKNLVGVFRRRIADIGFDADYDVVGELKVVAGQCPKRDAVGALLGMTMIVVAKEIDSPHTMRPASISAHVESSPTEWRLRCDVLRLDRASDDRLQIGSLCNDTKNAHTAQHNHCKERTHSITNSHFRHSPCLLTCTPQCLARKVDISSVPKMCRRDAKLMNH